jgi:hypothetical protein
MAILFEIVVFCLSIIEVSFSQNRAAEHLLSKKGRIYRQEWLIFATIECSWH